MTDLYYPHNETIERIDGLSAQDKGFLSDIMTRFPRVKQGFKTFINTAPMSRVRLAARVNNEQPRTGWKRFNTKPDTIDVLNKEKNKLLILMTEDISNIETVARHSMEAAELFPIIFTNHKYCGFGMEVMKFHDFCEAIVSDFTPHDKITKAEKAKLEEIALNVLTESRKSGDLLALHIYNCMNVYEGNVKDFSEVSMPMLKEIETQEMNGKITPAQQSTVGYFKKWGCTG